MRFSGSAPDWPTSSNTPSRARTLRTATDRVRRELARRYQHMAHRSPAKLGERMLADAARGASTGLSGGRRVTTSGDSRSQADRSAARSRSASPRCPQPTKRMAARDRLSQLHRLSHTCVTGRREAMDEGGLELMPDAESAGDSAAVRSCRGASRSTEHWRPTGTARSAPGQLCARRSRSRVEAERRERGRQRAGVSRVEEEDLLVAEVLADRRQIGCYDGHAHGDVLKQLRREREAVEGCREVGDHADRRRPDAGGLPPGRGIHHSATRGR